MRGLARLGRNGRHVLVELRVFRRLPAAAERRPLGADGDDWPDIPVIVRLEELEVVVAARGGGIVANDAAIDRKPCDGGAGSLDGGGNADDAAVCDGSSRCRTACGRDFVGADLASVGRGNVHHRPAAIRIERTLCGEQAAVMDIERPAVPGARVGVAGFGVGDHRRPGNVRDVRGVGGLVSGDDSVIVHVPCAAGHGER